MARGRRQPQSWTAWLVGGVFAVLPDMDTGLGVLLGRSTEFHGIFTHTPLAALTVALLVWPLSDATLPSLIRVLPSVPWRRGEGPEEAAVSLFDSGVFGSLVAQTAAGVLLFAFALLVWRVLGGR